MVTTFYPPFHLGGDAIYVQSLARALHGRGHEVEVVHCVDAFNIVGGKHTVRPAMTDDGVVVHRLQHALGRLSPLITQQTGRPGLKRKRLQELLDRDFEVIHYHNISLVGGPGVLALGHARAKLYSLHEHWLLCPTHIFWKNRERACDRPTCWSCCLRSGVPPQLWRLGGFMHRALGHVDLLLSPSEYTANRHRAGGISRPIEVLPLFSRLTVDPPRAPDNGRRPRYLFVGRITASKGIRSLVELFADLPQYDLLVAGDGDLRGPLQAEFRGAANIRFLGTVEAAELAALYAGATATVIPSLAPETFGLVAVESFACSTPVLALEAGGCGEVVRSSGAGFVCRDMHELRAAIHQLARNPKLARELGRLGRQAYERHYSERRHVDAYLARVHALLAVREPH